RRGRFPRHAGWRNRARRRLDQGEVGNEARHEAWRERSKLNGFCQPGSPCDDEVNRLVARGPSWWRQRVTCQVTPAPIASTYTAYSDWLAAMKRRLRFGPPKQTLAQISGSLIRPMRVPSGAKICTPS